MKTLSLRLFFPVLLTLIAPSVYAAPRVPGKAPAPVKRPIRSADSAQVAAQFERIAKAYSALGPFAVTVVDNVGMGKEIDRTKYTAYFGADGHLGLKLAQLDRRGQVSGNNFTQLYDGQEIIMAVNGELAQRSEVKKAGPETTVIPITEFFSRTFGAQILGVLSQYKRGPEGYNIYGKYSLQTLPGGKTRIENITTTGSSQNAMTGTTVFTVGASGFVERIEANGFEKGRKTFHAVSNFSRPTALGANVLTWEKFGPPPNPNFSIDAPSREVFERAAMLYGEAKTFTTKISGTVQRSEDSAKEPVWTADIAWERRGRLRLQSSRSSMVYAFDGTSSHVIADGTLRKVPTFTTTPDELTFQLLQTSVPDDDPFMRFPGLLVNLLQGKTTDFTRGPGGIDTRKVTLEADAVLYDLPCQVVNVVATVKSKTQPVTLQDRYWFTKSDGRLLRVTSSLKLKDSLIVTDVRLNGQKLDSQFPDSTWVLTAPAKKK